MASLLRSKLLSMSFREALLSLLRDFLDLDGDYAGCGLLVGLVDFLGRVLPFAVLT